jgi:DNA-binding SARP family transcriptional activator
MLKLVVLGTVAVSVDDRPIPIRRAQRRAVLAFLLLHANRTVTVAELVDAVWGADPPATARTQIFAAVSAVRRALRSVGADPVTSVLGGYRLDAAADEFDWHQEAWRLLARARAALADSTDMLAQSQLSLRYAELLTAAGRTGDAIETLTPALDGARSFGNRHPATRILIALAEAHGRRDPGQAASLAAEAVASARDGQFRLLEGQALTALAVARRRLGRHADARAAAADALRVHEETGHEPGRRKTEELLALLEPV